MAQVRSCFDSPLLFKEGQDVRIVQAFAGHLKPSTHRTTHLEKLLATVDKY